MAFTFEETEWILSLRGWAREIIRRFCRNFAALEKVCGNAAGGYGSLWIWIIRGRIALTVRAAKRGFFIRHI